VSSPIPDDALLCPVCGKPIYQGERFIVGIECVTEYVHDHTPIEGREGLPVRRVPIHLGCVAFHTDQRESLTAKARKVAMKLLERPDLAAAVMEQMNLLLGAAEGGSDPDPSE